MFYYIGLIMDVVVSRMRVFLYHKLYCLDAVMAHQRSKGNMYSTFTKRVQGIPR